MRSKNFSVLKLYTEKTDVLDLGIHEYIIVNISGDSISCTSNSSSRIVETRSETYFFIFQIGKLLIFNTKVLLLGTNMFYFYHFVFSKYLYSNI